MTSPHRPVTSPRRRIVAVGVGLPALLLLAALGVMLWALPDLPSPVATHWGPSGQPDGFGSPVLSFVLLPVVVIGWIAFALVVARRLRPAGPAVNQKLVLATGVFLSAYLGTLIAGSFVIQRGVADAQDSGSILPVLLLSTVVGAVLAVAAWFLLPPAAAGEPVPPLDELPARSLTPSERVSWVRRVEPRSRSIGVILGIAGVLIVASALLALGTQPLLALIFVLPAALIALGYALTFWTMTIDRHGLVARGGPGWPTIRIPLDQIEAAQVISVDPIVDFGGWGLRWAPGRTGIILQRGTALEVRRVSGRDLVVTLDDATGPAELLNGLVRRHRSDTAS